MCPLAMCKPALTLILGGIMPSSGVAVFWEIDEHAGLWLGGTLQRRSWLRDSSPKDNPAVYISSLQLYIWCQLNNHDEHVNAGNVCVCFSHWLLSICVCWWIMHPCMHHGKLLIFRIDVCLCSWGCFPGCVWCLSCPLCRSEGWGRDSYIGL